MKKVLIMVDTSRLTGRELLSGAERYISAFARWEVNTLWPNYLEKDLHGLEIDRFDGFFVCYTDHIEPFLNSQKPKIIHHTPREILPGASLIVTHSEKIGQMAGDYFRSLGFRHFAYCGFQNISWSDQRHLSFVQAVGKDATRPVSCFIDSPPENPHRTQRRLADWLKQLPKPTAIFACNDDRAIYILEACKGLRLNVPEEVAVLGVDNDSLICNLSSPPLSSIALNFESIGFQAARHLDKMMNGQAEDAFFYVDPIEVVTRKSTDVLAIDDTDLVAAVQFIRDHYHEPILVGDVVNATALSRRELEYRFKHTLNRTIKKEIERLRIDDLKKRLLNSREPVYTIAGDLQFIDPEHFSRYFKHQTGMTPSAFRQKHSR